MARLSPGVASLDKRGGDDDREDGGKVVSMFDNCDPVTFNAALGHGECVPTNNRHTITFQGLIDELIATRTVKTYKFEPGSFGGRPGERVLAVNRGGEDHTFTPVKNFGGGIVPILNNLSGTPIPAPECLALGPSAFVAPGGKFAVNLSSVADQKFMCCIHPWMKATARVRADD